MARAVTGGKLSAQEAVRLVERIVWTTELSDLEDAEVVVEAIVEDLDAKRELFARIDAGTGAEHPTPGRRHALGAAPAQPAATGA